MAPAPVQTNLFAMPLVSLSVSTGTNEDWISAIQYLVQSSTVPPPATLPQLDLRGIRFEMEVRPTITSNDVILTASTDDGTLMIGAAPDIGFFLFHIPIDSMSEMFPGNYVGEVRGEDGFGMRRVIDIALEIVEGIVRS
jgi:hypothetical protein